MEWFLDHAVGTAFDRLPGDVVIHNAGDQQDRDHRKGRMGSNVRAHLESALIRHNHVSDNNVRLAGR